MGAERVNFAPRHVIIGAYNLGIIAGGVDWDEEIVDHEITDDREGGRPVGKIRQYKKITLKVVAKEVDDTFYKEVLAGNAVNIVTVPAVCSIPEHGDQAACEGAGGTWKPSYEVVASGSSLNGKNLFTTRKSVTLHPVGVDMADRSKDVHFWSCEIKLDGTRKMSGQEEHTVGLIIEAFTDDTKPIEVDEYVKGDWSHWAA